MANYTIDPNLGFLNPTPGVDGGIGVAPAGQDYATLTSNALTTIGGHGHTGAPSDGKQIVTAAININGDLSFNSNNAINLRATRFINNASTLSGTADVLETYVYSNNLYYNNGTGTPVQITNGSSLAGSGGSGNSLLYAYLSVTNSHTILSTDQYTFFNTTTVASVITYTLPLASAMAAGTYYIFKDASGYAASNNIVINKATGSSNTIDGAASYVLAINYGTVTLVCDGSANWRVQRPDTISIQGNSVSASAPGKGQFMVATSSSSYGPTSPSGDIAYSNTTAGKLTVTGIQGVTVYGLAAATAGQFLIPNVGASLLAWTTISGDIIASTSTPGALTVNSIQGVVITGTPSAGKVLTATSSTAAHWQ